MSSKTRFFMKKLLFVIGLVAATMIVLALAAYWQLGPFEPEKEVRRMLFLMSDLQTVKYKGGLSWSMEEAKRTTSTLASGQLNFSHPYALEHKTAFRVVNLQKEKPARDLSGEIIALNEDTFIKFDQPGAILDGVAVPSADSWIRFDNPFGQSILRAFLPGSRHEMKTVRAWSPESLPLLRDLIAQADVWHITFNNQSEEVGGVKTRVFDASFDPQAVRAFLLDATRARQGREPNNAERLAVENYARYLEPLRLRLWIGIKDHLLYRWHAIGIVSEERDRRAVDLKIEFFGFNSKFLVQAPNQYLDFSALSYQQQNLPAALTITPDQINGSLAATGDVISHLPQASSGREEISQDPDNDGLDNTLEFFYGTDPYNPDTDGDGVSDGDEVLSGRNPKGTGSLFGFGLGQ